MPRGYRPYSSSVFKTKRKPNYEAMKKAIAANKSMPEATKKKALATIKRKQFRDGLF